MSAQPAKDRRPARIVRVIDRLNIGGPTHQVLLLTRDLKQCGYQTVLVKGQVAPGEEEMSDAIRRSGVQPLEFSGLSRAISPIDDLKSLWSLYRLIRRIRPDVVHTHKPKAGVVGRLAAWLAGVPVTVHTFHGHLLQHYFPGWISRLILILERILAYRTDAIVGVSRQTHRDLVSSRLTAPSRIHAIPLGLELQPFVTSRRLNGRFRTDLNLSADVPLIGMVTRLAPIKAVDTFLKAAKEVLSKAPQVRFVVVGDGELRGELEALTRKLGISDRVSFTGFRIDVVQIYAALNLLVLSSLNEGLPVTLIEGIASGCYVVATRVGGVPELVESTRTGITVESGNVSALSKAMIQAIESKREVPVEVREEFGQRFGVKRLTDDLDHLYRKLFYEKSQGVRISNQVAKA